MADKRISQFTELQTLASGDKIPILSAGAAIISVSALEIS